MLTGFATTTKKDICLILCIDTYDSGYDNTLPNI